MDVKLKTDLKTKASKLRVRSSLVLAAAVTVLSTAAQANDTYDVPSLEVYGIQTGITPEEFMDRLSEHLSLDRDAFFVDRNKYGAPKIDPVTKIENALDRILYQTDEVKLFADFSPEVANEPPTIALTTLALTFVKDRPNDLIEKLQQDFIEKYGPPSVVLQLGIPKWCAELDETKTDCHETKRH